MAENLQLNEKGYESLRDDKHTRYVDQMPLAVANGCRPINFAEVMGQRVGTSGDVQKNWQFNWIDTSDGCPTHPDGSFKVVPDCEILLAVNPQTVLNSRGAISLTEEVYRALPGAKFSKKDREKLTGKWQTEKQAKKNKVLYELARRDQDLLNQNVEVFFKYLRDTRKLTEGMAVILADAQNVPELRAWCACLFDINYCRSSALGSYCLDGNNARLVRVRVGAGGAVETPRSGAPEKLVVAPSLEQILAIGRERIAPALLKDFEADARKLYKN